MCVCVWEYVCAHVYSACEGQKGASDHTVKELQIVISCSVLWVLETEPWFSVQAAGYGPLGWRHGFVVENLPASCITWKKKAGLIPALQNWSKVSMNGITYFDIPIVTDLASGRSFSGLQCWHLTCPHYIYLSYHILVSDTIENPMVLLFFLRHIIAINHFSWELGS